ncbi:autotransporter outer membrane beta-barrel domain-containing protein [Achromobacter spanius]|uniref:autotransporter outer membrane beta-barrel domain-containing protein n=1 Tax=Achromobacter spanius TaxID=217203 RepID=UPI0037F4AB13
MTHSASPFRLTQLAAAIAGVLLTGTTSAQLTCPPGANGTLTCNFSSQFGSPVVVQPPGGYNSPVPVMNVTTSSTINAAVTAYTPAGLSVLAFGNPGNTSSLNGYSAAGLNVNNSGNITLSPSGALYTSSILYGLLAQMRGGDAASSSNDENGGGGGNAGTTSVVTLINTGSVDMTQLAGVTTPGGAALAALSEGGAGASTDDDHNPYGPGGQSAGAHINNSGAITATLMGTGRFAGIQAASNGGYGATQYNGGGNYGGGAGNVSIVNSGQVAVNWTWANGSSGSNAGLYGILAESHGGNGGDSATGGLGNGGAGGNASSAVVTLQGGSVTVNQTGTSPVTGAGVAAILLGGDAGNGLADEDYTSGGNAGNAGTITAGAPPSSASVQINNTGTSVTTTGSKLPALRLWAQGGAGGGQFNQGSYHDRNGGIGGISGDASLSVTTAGTAVALSTNGDNSPGVQTLQQGGAGGVGAPYSGDALGFGSSNAGNGGSGGNVGSLTLQLNGTSAAPINITTTGTQSHGIYSLLQGGLGAYGGELSGTLSGGQGGNGGAGGSTGATTMNLQGTRITTQGATAIGVLAQSLGQNGGAGGTSTLTVAIGSNGGNGGSTGNLNITTDAASSIVTQGANAAGIVAQTASGAGGVAGATVAQLVATPGVGGSGGTAGSITINNAASIKTAGTQAIGVLAQSLAGGGGAGGDGSGIFFSEGGTGGSSGVAGTISVSNAGAIVTQGDVALGVLAQSIGGSGGVGGSSAGVGVSLGGDPTSNPDHSNGSTVNFHGLASGSITTSGTSALGVLAQSIGGGGGAGGASQGWFSLGGSGGQGGSGGTVIGNLQSFLIQTAGDNAHGYVGQSIGGGGGNAGNASSTGIAASIAIGQSGGGGGNGNAVVANLTNSSIVTQGSKAAGLIAQSVGGGGGVGGRAFGTAVGPAFTGAVAIGGQGGTGGNGGQVSAQLVGSSIKTAQVPQLTGVGCSPAPCAATNLLPVDAFGVVIQSIGGGGGLGGNATANAATIAIPVTPNGSQISIATAVSLGGKGGIAGDGQYTTFAASQGSQITTAGQGSHGVLIQSIGGGGGAGGDSSSLAASLGYGELEGTTSLSIDTSVSLGGSGGAAGNGGPVWTAVGGLINVANNAATFTADAASSPRSSITTYGDYANGITAQSIGGGGGNAGFGSANTQNFGTGTNFSPSFALGGTGSGGGNGNTVGVQVMPSGLVQTWGSGAIGVLAQSIGGGGGASQGGSFTVSGATGNKGGSVSFKTGSNGGAGGQGGAVNVTVGGAIVTAGADAPGVQAQSIGGGGGQAGAAGSDASFDNPILGTLDARASASDVAKAIYNWTQGTKPTASLHFQASLSFGGEGGPGNTGGAVGLAMQPGALIQTTGDFSTGMFAQSVGGGGGKGGSAFATGTGWIDPKVLDLNTNITMGGSGGNGANGGAVTTSLDGGAISTQGFAAAGIYTQSVGGGGGHGASGSDGFVGTLALGIAGGGTGGGGGSGGAVTLNTSGASTQITTTGEAGFGAVLQSVGGGGGFAGAGTSARISVADDTIPAFQMEVSSGVNQSQGQGGAVTVNDASGLLITTSGNNAYGLVGQSVGGAGGMIINSQNQQRPQGIATSITGAQGYGAVAGGAVNISLASQSRIQTSGTGAHGVIAQSVGAGGGIIGLPGTGAALVVDPSQSSMITAGFGAGGAVNVNANGTVAVSGPGAIGILAQSVNGAGGLVLTADGQSVYAGGGVAPYGNNLDSGTVNVTVGQGGVVSATGANGFGIFAQSANANTGATVTVAGQVSGGTATNGAGVWIDGNQAGTLVVDATGSVSGNGGTAIQATGATLGVINNGTVSGSVNLNGGSMNNNGSYIAGAQFVGESLTNTGLIALGGTEGASLGSARTRFTGTTLIGTLTQTATGVLRAGADFNVMYADMLTVNGPAQLEGGMMIAPRALMPNRELSILTVDGPRTGTLTGVDSPVFDYETRQVGNTTRIHVAGANFNAGSMQLKRNQSGIATHLQRTWDQGGAVALSGLYAVLDTASRDGARAYQDRVSDLSPGVALAPAAQMQFGLARFSNAMMSCPTFAGSGSLTREQNCLWGEVTARRTNQDAANGSSSFTYDSQTYQFGGQREVAPDWYLGGSVAYQNTRVRGDDRRVSGSGDSGYAGVVLKRQAGPWTFSGALGGGYGSYGLTRNLAIANFDSEATSAPNVYSLGARLRAARTFDQGNFYLKPYADLTASYSRMPGYSESGDALRLKVDSSHQFVLGLAPTLEIGGRVDLPQGAMMRPFAYAGVSFLSEDGWETTARLQGASSSAGKFTTRMPTDNVIGRVGAGLQVASAGKVDFRLQYDGEFASRGSSHSGSLKLAVPF